MYSQGYQWLKDKILTEEGRRQQGKLKELQGIAERLSCTLPQLAIGKDLNFIVEQKMHWNSNCLTPFYCKYCDVPHFVTAFIRLD